MQSLLLAAPGKVKCAKATLHGLGFVRLIASSASPAERRSPGAGKAWALSHHMQPLQVFHEHVFDFFDIG